MHAVRGSISKNGVPAITIVISGTAIAMIVIVSQGNLESLASIFNFGILMTFLFINLSMIRLRQKMPNTNRSFKVPLYPLPPVLGVLSCMALVFYLDLNAIIFAVAWIAIGVAVYEYSRKLL